MIADFERFFPVAAATVTIVSLPRQRDARVDQLQGRVTEIEFRFAVAGIEEVADDPAVSRPDAAKLGPWSCGHARRCGRPLWSWP